MRMAEDGIPAYSSSGGTGTGLSGHNDEEGDKEEKKLTNKLGERLNIPHDINIHELISPALPPTTPNYFSRKNTTIDMEDYFQGPRDISKHSKWPMFLQVHGSIMPKVVLPLLAVGVWSTAITVISELVYELGVESILLTVLGFVVALALSFRSSTAYERYSEGRRYWTQLILATQTMGRVFWVHAKDNPKVTKKESTLRRISCLNLLQAYSVALMHKLRYEPYTGYEDLEHLVAHIDSFARAATAADPDALKVPKKTFYKSLGEWLGVPMAESNPRKNLKKATQPLGNLPLEILSHLSMLVDAMVADEQITIPMQQTIAYNHLTILNDILTGTERVLTTPLPIAYTIAIAQITYLYVFLLPFQLHRALGWITIPATIAAAYIILGILLIGREVENPFGNDVNDLPLEVYCAQIAQELDVIASMEVPRSEPYSFIESTQNLPLWPVSMAPYPIWAERAEDKINSSIKGKPNVLFQSRKKSREDREREEALRRRRTAMTRLKDRRNEKKGASATTTARPVDAAEQV